MSERQSHYSVTAPNAHRKIDDDDDFPCGDECERSLNEEDLAALALLDDDPATTVQPHCAAGLPLQPPPELPAPALTENAASICDDDRGLPPAEVDDVISQRDDIVSDQQSVLPASNVIAVPASASPSRTRQQAKMLLDWKAAKTRKRNRDRKRKHRAKSRQPTARALGTALRKYTAKPRGDKRIEQLAGREEELAGFLWLSRIVIGCHGPMSDAKLADYLGDGYTRNQVYRLRKIIVELQAEGQPWHNL